MLNMEGDGEITRKTFLTGMQRLIFSNEFQKACLHLLAASEVQAMQRNLHKMHEVSVEKHFKLLHGELKVFRDQGRWRGGTICGCHIHLSQLESICLDLGEED